FKNGSAAANSYRNPILGLDSRDGGAGILNGLAYWNMDFSVRKTIRVAESVSLELEGVVANVLNHMQWLDPQWNAATGLADGNTPDGGFGTLQGEAGPRQIQIGGRIRF
ncbi:MAG: hypothetical protein ACJ713_15540, partial [Candidatus Sulfotelmatobacter sp.]